MVVNLSNPKSLVYFTSVFTALIPADAPPTIRLAAVVIVVGESATWHSLLALLFSRNRLRRLYARLGAWIGEASAASSSSSGRASSGRRAADELIRRAFRTAARRSAA